MRRLAKEAWWWELYATASLSCALTLRVVEAILDAYNGEYIMYMGAKGRKVRHTERPGLWAKEWEGYLLVDVVEMSKKV